MYTNVNLAAPIGALALLGTGFILFEGIILLIHFGHENSLPHNKTRFQV